MTYFIDKTVKTSDSFRLYGFPVKTCFDVNYTQLVIFLTGIGEVLYLPGRHIPIDTSLCSQSPQVRIYGFVAAGITPSKANKEAETHKTRKQQVIPLSEPVNLAHLSGHSTKCVKMNNTVFINQSL